MSYRMLNNNSVYRTVVDINTGVTRKIYYASDKQFAYLQSLREQLGKEPLKHKPTVFQAKKQIERLLKKTAQQRLI